MITAKQLILWITILMALSGTACSEERKMTAGEVRSSIDRALATGASAADIEQFFRQHDLPYTYDRFAKRYQSIIRDVSPDPTVDHAIVIYIYVDDAKTFTKAEVRDSFT
jgi:hypothetical protein